MTDQEPIKGLTTGAAQGLQERYGKNQLAQGHNQSFFGKVIHIICEPMFLLLLAAGALYFISGEPINTAIMLALVVGIISIDVLQGRKTDKTLNALKDLTALHSVVLRDGKEKTIASRDLVPGDVVLIDEGVKIPADGPVLKQNNLRVDESSITGEAAPAWKVCRCNAKPSADHWRRDYCYAGTLVTHGNGYILVEKIGSLTEYGKIASHVASAPQDPPPLRKQTSHMVRLCAGISAVLFASVSLISWMNIPDLSFSNRLIGSILSGITLAMAMIPEEFPVILTVFLSMGAWRLAKKGSVVVHNLPAVETLGAVSVLCVDKTGIITMDHVTVQDTWAVDGNTAELCEIMGLACETEAHSPMEKAMLSHCEKLGIRRGHLLSGELLNEYAFSNNLKMMGHVWRHDGEILIAAKGSPDRLLTICGITDAERQTAESRIAMMSQEGLSVIAVAVQRIHAEGEIPSEISGCSLILRGLAGLADPPRENVKANIALCCKAGIRVVMITDDNPLTAASIARQVGVPNYSNVITGEELDALTNEQLLERVKKVNVFSHIMPEHKLRIVKAFQANGEIVAMTGDGVNDAPSLKHSDIGIAMGTRGTDASREAADLILMDDNFSTIVGAMQAGRGFYHKIRRAVGYVLTVHIPIVLATLLAPLLGIAPSGLVLLPIHVVLLELIINPLCALVLERQPDEADIMSLPPRDPREKLFTPLLLLKSSLQGLAVFVASFGAYLFMLSQNPGNAAVARTMGLAVIMLANLLLVQVNSSNHDFAYISAKLILKDKVMMAVNLVNVVGLLLIIYTPISGFLALAPLSPLQFVATIGIAAVSVLWFELVKLVRKKLRG